MMNISYDYEELIQELKEEIFEGVLSLNDTIYVLREEKTFNVSIPTQGKRVIMYNPIIDWFYGDENVIDYSLLLPHEIDLQEKRKEQYIESKDKLLKMTVKECLNYMEQHNKII